MYLDVPQRADTWPMATMEQLIVAHSVQLVSLRTKK